MRGLHDICSVAIGKTGLGCVGALKPSHTFEHRVYYLFELR